MGKLLIILLGGLGLACSYFLYGILSDAPAPTLPDFYWGPKVKEGQKEDTSIRPFSIQVDESVLADLKARLKLETEGNRLLPPLEGTGFQYGFNSNYLKEVTNYWLNKYSWRSREKLLNQYPQFKTTVSGIEIHFQHIKKQEPGKPSRPLLLLHGWPGSFVEFQKAIPLLLDHKGSDINFELIIPSLPGYGFSERSHRPGLGPVEMSQVFLKLMERLGHKEFYVQGGDWGAIIATNMASLYPHNIKALHMNLCISQHIRSTVRLLLAALYPALFIEKNDTTALYPLPNYAAVALEETGYLHIQATKPDTIGAALTNSPTGLAAYILEKFSTWTNLEWKTKADGGLPYYNMDELLDNLMVYWVTGSVTSSLRLYSEGFNRRTRAWNLENVPVQVPSGCLSSPQEYLGGQTRFHLQDKFPNLISYTNVKVGGHFSAFEVPNTFVEDVVNFFNLVERSKTV